MKRRFILVALLFSFLTVAQPSITLGGYDLPFPESPDPSLTPGSLCSSPDELRYPERIVYCRRDVDRRLKQKVIQEYDLKLGYHVSEMNRNKFKIDHYIPLCAGGSNRADNLWPQHESVYTITDRMEQRVCEKMAQGRLRQKDAIALIRTGKGDLDRVSEILNYLEAL